ncbi:hypothetical protein CFC21_085207 [Triticum aestivum]|uniref:Uncharacterized protein n=2 Tax=Triticum aestivum TaxID=4565 RepID=A0A3B6NWY0_WHEAT|nr:hypothetical protein CFC21_085207 [Triticum aestivum]
MPWSSCYVAVVLVFFPVLKSRVLMFFWWAFKPLVFAFCPKLMKIEVILVAYRFAVFQFSLRSTNTSVEYNGSYGSASRPGSGIAGSVEPKDVFEGGFCLFMKATKKENLIKFLEGKKDFIFRQNFQSLHLTISSPAIAICLYGYNSYQKGKFLSKEIFTYVKDWLSFVVRSRSRVLSGGSVALFSAFVFVVSYTFAYTLTHYHDSCSKMLEETNRATDDNTLLALVQFEVGCSHDIDVIHNNRGSFDIWIDRCSVVDYDDGLIDVMRQSIYIACLQAVPFSVICPCY